MFSLLHIDNNFFYREILHKLSLEKSFSYFSAKTPDKAYEILKNQPIDIVVTSLEFENISEIVFIETLMSLKNPNTAVVVLSAIENLELKNKLLELGVREFIGKDQLLVYCSHLISKFEANDFISSKLQNLSIAVLDDTLSHLLIIKDILTKYEILNVDYFQSYDSLKESKKSYDIYLLDYILPDINGDAIISEIRDVDEYAVIITISSITSPSVISNILMSGADDFINKPFSEDILMARLKTNVRTYFLMEALKQKNDQLSKLAIEDSLTGLYNHRHILECVTIEIDRAIRFNMPLSILMFDIDHFKMINDTYGHHIGDSILSYIGNLWANKSRTIDIAGRYGGDEFVIILPNTDLNGAKVYAERLRKSLERAVIGIYNVKFTISGGVAQFSGECSSELIQNADAKLYLAKQSGRNKIES